ncbi:MAG: Ig-like domain-containing protein [Bacteroidales bacterium]|nr:Ig-like domain-containing protein [Bacteroidales bacterium]
MRFFPSYLAARTIAFALLSSLLFACREKPVDKPEPIPGPGPGPVIEFTEKSERGAQVEESGVYIDMPETSVFVKDDINHYLIEYDALAGKLVFQTSETVDNAGIKEGDVLFSAVIPDKAPKGYMVRVNKITRTDSRTTFEVSEAELEDAFEELSIDYSMQSVVLSEENITVYDPFAQEDLSADSGPQTKGITSIDLDFSEDKYKLGGDKFEVSVESDHATVEIVVLDLDEDYEKTQNDQARLVFTLEYTLNDGEFRFSSKGEDGFINAGMDLDLGGFAGIKFGKEKKEPGKNDIIKAFDKEDLNQFETKVEQKLMGKKIRVATCDIPVELIPGIGPVLGAIIQPRIDLYMVYNVKLKGAFQIGFVWEKANFSFCVGNSGDNFSETDEKKSKFDVDLGDVHFDMLASADIKGSIGAGVGLVVSPAKKIEALFKDKENKPYAGGFFEFTGNVDLKFKADFNFLDHVVTGMLSGTGYFKTEAFLEAYARMQVKWPSPLDLIWHLKVDWPRLSYKIPDPPKEIFSVPFTIESEYPIPFLVAPLDRALVTKNQVDLPWDIPFHMHAGTSEQGYFDGVHYTVYASTDKVLVEQSSPRALVASDLEKGEKHFTMEVEPVQAYYWKVISTNQYGWDYASPVFSFDTGYDGALILNAPLTKYLSDYQETIPGVRIEEDGFIYLTPSNVLALEAVKSLVIQDPDDKYHIETIDDLLVHLPSLEDLNCSHNSIKSLNIKANRKLKSIACQNNDISSLDLKDVPALQGLKCSGNQALRSLDLRNCPELEVLTCDKCNLEEIDLSFSQKLRDMYASENHLSFLDISRCSSLLRLDVYSQSVDRLTLRLTHAQMDRFALFKRHVYMDFDYVDVSGILTDEATDITSTSAKVTVTALEQAPLSFIGVIYSDKAKEPDIYDNSGTVNSYGKLHGTFSIGKLRPATKYYARGYAKKTENNEFIYGNVVQFTTGAGDPVPKMVIDPDILEFGEITIGTVMSQSLTIRNDGDADLTFRIISPDNSAFWVDVTSKVTLKPGESQKVTVSFQPNETGEVSGEFPIRSNDPRGDLGFIAWGTGTEEFIPVRSIYFKPDDIVIGRGDRVPLHLFFNPANATYRDFDLKSSDESVAYISGGGSVGGASAGTATITASTWPLWGIPEWDGEIFTATCTVTVKVYIERLFWLENGIKTDGYGWSPEPIVVGETRMLRIAYEPEDATETDIIWKSDDPSVLSVSGGKITALKPGRTTVRAIVADEAKGHIEVSREYDVQYPSGSHEGIGDSYWD